MAYILGLLALAAGALIWIQRARNAAEISHDVIDMAQTAMGAARRWGFRRKTNVHPVDAIDEPPLAIGGLATAYLELEGLPTAEAKEAMTGALRAGLDITQKDAEELVILGHWFVQECSGPVNATPRLARRLYKLTGPEGLAQVMPVISAISETGGGSLTDRQREALDEIKSAFRIR